MNLRVGVVGVGKWGRNHARVYSQLPGVTLAGVVDIVPQRAREVANQYHTTPYSRIQDIWDKVEAVSITVPTHKHFPVAKSFLRKGIHIFLEKPMTENLSQAESLIRESRRRGVILQIGHIERFGEAFRRMKPLISSPRFIESHRLTPFTGRGTEVGVVLDLMIHDLDLILHLVKSPVKKVEALGVAALSPREDIANARIHFHNGCVANVTASRVSEEKMRKLRIFQPDTYISLDFLSRTLSIYRRKVLPGGKEEAVIEKEVVSFTGEESLKAELEDFLRCVREGRRPAVSGEEGKEALKLALRITREIEKSAVFLKP